MSTVPPPPVTSTDADEPQFLEMVYANGLRVTDAGVKVKQEPGVHASEKPDDDIQIVAEQPEPKPEPIAKISGLLNGYICPQGFVYLDKPISFFEQYGVKRNAYSNAHTLARRQNAARKEALRTGKIPYYVHALASLLPPELRGYTGGESGAGGRLHQVRSGRVHKPSPKFAPKKPK